MPSFCFESVFGGPAAAEARAPGRVNLIGEHTDYNGGLVLPAAISLQTRVAVRFREDGRVVGASRERGRAEAELAAAPDGCWLDHLRGVARVLADQGRIPARGFDASVAGDVPEGSGLSSSAALGVAAAHALARAAGTPFRAGERTLVAELAHRAETGFVGVPCGIMDPYAVACAESGAALLLDCASRERRAVPLPEGIALLVFDTGTRRELRDGRFEARVSECEQARTAAAALLTRPLASLSRLESEDLSVLELALDATLFRRARHVLGENARVRACVAALEAGDLATLGAELYASHDSLAGDYEVSWPEADWLVAASRPLAGVIGARMTGAGFGGCTLHLVLSERAAECDASLRAGFEREFGRAGRSWTLRPSGPAGVVS